MAVRASMGELIGHLRSLIADPAGASPVFADQALQDALDARRVFVRYADLDAAPSIQPGGGVVYLDYFAPVGDWEADESLVDGAYNGLTPATSDRISGHWTLTASPRAPVMITGKVYDLYAAAADVLERWAAQETLSYDMTIDGTTLRRSQKNAMLLALAQQYRRQQRPVVAVMVRSDVSDAR